WLRLAGRLAGASARPLLRLRALAFAALFALSAEDADQQRFQPCEKAAGFGSGRRCGGPLNAAHRGRLRRRTRLGLDLGRKRLDLFTGCQGVAGLVDRLAGAQALNFETRRLEPAV